MCNKPGHLARNCQAKSTVESSGQTTKKSSGNTRQVSTECKASQGTSSESQPVASKQSQVAEQVKNSNLLGMLLSSSEDEPGADTRLVRVQDRDSRPQCAKFDVQGVPSEEIINSGADITIMSGTLFGKVAAVAQLKKRDLKNPDKIMISEPSSWIAGWIWTSLSMERPCVLQCISRLMQRSMSTTAVPSEGRRA